ncbi:hypothetical protein Bresa_01490|uniref:Uncharacterized protein n=1 Tax=Brenneria salicis ATCC 15712 = DSM 30166 TaxID=714314 RepID=A0A366HYR3_9GAMM|nr:hypothetical protein [Brenneria salicis ATCC 15712 = DSM 30166]RBP57839.1 hypothetical protein DES54_1585 [Brenneria salicis ATCC 15712 = DSM 30166]
MLPRLLYLQGGRKEQAATVAFVDGFFNADVSMAG